MVWTSAELSRPTETAPRSLAFKVVVSVGGAAEVSGLTVRLGWSCDQFL
jgi:hypothetical protein